jgi:poly-gamma-glutamate synthesis protein (capsule biosynthesis protein)
MGYFMKKIFFVTLIIIFILSSCAVFAFHVKIPDSFVQFNDIVKKHKKNNSPTKEAVLPDSINTPEATRVKSLSFSFAGDVLLDGNVAVSLQKNGSEYIIEGVKNTLSASDIAMVNLENPISLRGTKAKDKQYTFRVNPKHMDVLTSSGIDVVTLANNHTLDYGKDALLDTFDNLNKINVKFVGAGMDINSASRPAVIDKNGYKTAILGSSHVIPEVSWAAGSNKPGLATTYDPSRLLSEISEAKKNSDIVVVYVHWGEERKTTPLNYQRNLAKKI